MIRHCKLGAALLLVASLGLTACMDDGPGRNRPPRHDRGDRHDRDRDRGDHRGDRHDRDRDRGDWNRPN
jgi:hypothetical protein